MLSGNPSFLSLVLETFVTSIKVEELKSSGFIGRIGKTEHIIFFAGATAIPAGQGLRRGSYQDRTEREPRMQMPDIIASYKTPWLGVPSVARIDFHLDDIVALITPRNDRVLERIHRFQL